MRTVELSDLGPSKYNAVALEAQKACGEDSSVFLLVVDGKFGKGAVTASPNPSFALILPEILRYMAKQMEQHDD